MSNTEEKVRSVIAKVFNLQLTEINENSSPDTIEAWDSMGHLNLSVALEETFNIEFSDDEIMELMNFKIICLTIDEKLKG